MQSPLTNIQQFQRRFGLVGIDLWLFVYSLRQTVLSSLLLCYTMSINAVERFLEEVSVELLYNIVYERTVITNVELREEFKKKTGHEPTDLFGFSNENDRDLFDLIQLIPGLKGVRVLTINDDSEEDDAHHLYKIFNTTYVSEVGVNKVSVAKYRENLLLQCCEIMKDDFTNLSSCRDKNGNTPLHLLAALPGLSYDCNTLLKYLLQAGVDPLVANNNRQTFFHIIFGKYEVDVEYTDAVCFKNERVITTKWFIDDRLALLKVVSEELSQAQITSLVKAQDKDGNTALHECALSTTIQQELIEERKIFSQLLELDVCVILRIPNNRGEVPLHYAFNPSIFKIFVQAEDAVCRARNDCDETPLLFIVKQSVGLGFAETSAAAELAKQGFLELPKSQNVRKAVQLLENITTILTENIQVRKTAFIPDMKGNVVVDILLLAIRIGSCDLNTISPRMPELRSCLVELLCKVICNASANDIKRQNNEGQNFLHVLLDMGDDSQHEIVKGAYMFQSVKILLEHDVDVNAVDFKGCTPLDIVHKLSHKGPVLYQKYAELLIENGAVTKLDSGNDSCLVEGLSDLRIINETRKLRSCPKRHLNTAERLTDPKTQVCVVGKYRYLSDHSIGSGAFSTIFVAIKDENVDSRSGVIECRAYALKRLEKAKINPQEIRREVTTLLSISGKCENIIKYYDSDEDDFFQYLCLDLMDGDLSEFVTNGEVNDVLKGNPVKVTKEIINGLAFLHEYDFIHRDLKPSNILYSTDPTLHFKIADFGLAKNMSSFSTMVSTGGRGVAMVPGTRCWMAPELVSMKSRDHTKMSDIFSLGLVLHYLLTLGKHPFAKRSDERPHVIERKIEEMQLHLDKTLHPEAISFLQVLLARDPSKRPPAKYLAQHPFLWSENKKIEFLKAVGDQPEASNPTNFPNSPLEKNLQNTSTGKVSKVVSWNQTIESVYEEMMRAWKQKKYRTDKVIDLIRFIRNSYAHKQERSVGFQKAVDENIFLRNFQSLVLDTFFVVQQLGFDEHHGRSNISQVLKL